MMTKIEDKLSYQKVMAKIEHLLPFVDDNTPKSDKNFMELDHLCELASEYEDEHYPIKCYKKESDSHESQI